MGRVPATAHDHKHFVHGNRNTPVRTIAALLLSLAIGGCTVTEANLIGRYICVYPYGSEMLVLRSDGSYTQLIDVDAPQGSVIHNGKWDRGTGLNQINLVDPLILDNNFGALRPNFTKPESGLWVLNVNKRFDTISLTWSPDFDYECRRL